MSSGTCTPSKTIKEKTVSSEAVFVVELAVNHRVDAEGGSPAPLRLPRGGLGPVLFTDSVHRHLPRRRRG